MKQSWLSLTLLLAGTGWLIAQQNFDKVEIKATAVAGNIHMLEGAGGNIGVSAGPDGVLIVDDQFAPLAAKIDAALAKLDKGALKFVLNTHWHGDHTGGNERFAEAGALIVAHDNVRKRMSTEQFLAFFNTRVEPSPKAALPLVTFSTDVTFHINGDEVAAWHGALVHAEAMNRRVFIR